MIQGRQPANVALAHPQSEIIIADRAELSVGSKTMGLILLLVGSSSPFRLGRLLCWFLI